ncbi:7-cyano-7-deazaguanine synthase [bacterium]|nr:7-cyano-7-deazaguanine synthase [bacterium]
MSDISVLFSGGPDSTLAVLRALKSAERVHLLTYHHGLMSRMGRHQVVTRELQQRFGEHRIIPHEEEIGKLYRQLYRADWQRRIPRYRSFYVPWLCGSCKLAMHCRTIAYNREHGIAQTYDGANKESSPLFPAQTRGYIGVMQQLYERQNMQYEAVIFDEENTDLQCEAQGMATMHATKKEHVYFSTQHSCYVGLVIHAHARLYYRPIRGKARMPRLAEQLLGEAIGQLDAGEGVGV